MKTYLKAKCMADNRLYDVYRNKGLFYIILSDRLIGLLSEAKHEPNKYMYYRHYEFSGLICETVLTTFEYMDKLPNVNQAFALQLSLF